MKITLFTANCTGVKTNCIYPNKVVAESKAELVEAILHSTASASNHLPMNTEGSFLHLAASTTSYEGGTNDKHS